MYAASIRDENRCDFPDCHKEFDHRRGKKVAILTLGKNVKAFCQGHCKRLVAEGLELRTLGDIHAQIKASVDAPYREAKANQQAEWEKAFIDGLRAEQG